MFCSFEGGDGVGKSTQIALLDAWLARARASRSSRRVSPAAPSWASSCARRCCTAGTSARGPRRCSTRRTARTTSRRWCGRRWSAARWCVTDRYLDSSVAYQGDGRELGAAEVEALSLWATEGLLPHLTVLLDLDPEVGLARLAGRSAAPDRLESAGLAFHRRTREAYLDPSGGQDPDRWLVLDATAPARGARRSRSARRMAPLVGVAP